MLVAALDTSTLTLSCAVCDVDGASVRVLAARDERAPAKPGPQGPTGGHGARLPGVLLEVLAQAGRDLADVEAYAVGLGPGSFTGLRIGLATWKGLAYAQRRPLAGASSLAAMALGAAGSAPEGALLVPLLDAKKGELYAGFYVACGGLVEAAHPEAALPPAALADRLAALAAAGSRPLPFGDGLAAYPSLGVAARADLAATPPALAVAQLCAGALAAPYDPAHLFALEPHYIRASEAELKFPHGHGPGASPPGTS
ncbi:MAG: tRNA (adenosine(37)-N6)-threonylcarbamoyltransferase complex dimerization subunit type 1 TsaB [Anaeromyxobacteraceae bacterium]